MERLKGKIKILRKNKGWAQGELAHKTGVSLSTVQRWERKVANPTLLARRELKRLFEEAGIAEV
jgi:transcriptional regulator with XRE-family HTH domain